MAIEKKDKNKEKISLLLEDLELLQSYVRDLFSFSPIPICFVGPAGIVLEANPALEKLVDYKIGEIVGGSQRSLDIEEMKTRLKEMGENIKNYEWYFDLRRYGSVPHAGYGLGVERVVAWICGLENIKDSIPFPRTLLRFRP